LPWGTPNPHNAPEDYLTNSQPLLFDLEADIGETTDVADQHPEVVERLLQLAEQIREDVGDYDRIGKHQRFFDPGEPRPDIYRAKAP